MTAFSRDQASKVYVQHRIVEAPHSHRVWDALQQHAVFVCGDGQQMAVDVRGALESVARDVGGLSPAEAASLVRSATHWDVWVV